MSDKTLGESMRAARQERDVTVTQLADELRTKHATLSMIEAGEEMPEKELAGRIKGWINSGRGAKSKAPRGPYHKTYGDGDVVRQKRSTIER